MKLLAAASAILATFSALADHQFTFVDQWIMCDVSQGSKGTYKTYLKSVAYDDKYFFVESHGKVLLKEEDRDVMYVHAVEHKKCKPLIGIREEK